MEFTEDSESLLDFFIEDFSKLRVKRSPIQQKRLDNILKILYNEIKVASQYVNLLWSLGEVKTEIVPVHSTTAPNSELLSTHLVPQAVRDYIQEHLTGYLVYRTKMPGRDVALYFGLMSQDDPYKTFDTYARRMLIWLRIASGYSSRQCGKKLKVLCYLTPFKKILPLNQYNVISPENCNSAVTTSCVTDGEILIYRREEVIKVFIHEVFHLFGLDFSGLSTTALNRRLRKLFPVKSQYNLYEAYSEFWASIINAAFCAYDVVGDTDDENVFVLYADFCIQFEQIFSLFQCVKVLDFMGLQYTNLYDNDNISRSVRKYLFKEKTNSFAYYIVKSNLLYFCSEFLHWCLKNNTSLLSFNKSTRHMDKFYKFVEKYHQDQKFVSDIDRMRLFLKSMKRSSIGSHYGQLTKTLRMSLCELAP